MFVGARAYVDTYKSVYMPRLSRRFYVDTTCGSKTSIMQLCVHGLETTRQYHASLPDIVPFETQDEDSPKPQLPELFPEPGEASGSLPGTPDG